MNWADAGIILILVVSSLFSLWQGLIKELLSMVNWLIAFILATMLRGWMAGFLVDLIETPSLRELTAFAIVFFVSLLIFAMINKLLDELIEFSGLGPLDHVFGLAFGAVRGFFLVMVILIVVHKALPVEQDPWWQESVLIPKLMQFEGWVKATLGDIIAWLKSLFYLGRSQEG